MTVDNEGSQPHQVELVRARDGASSSDIIAAVQRMNAAALDAMAYHGGPNEVPPGERRTTITDLEPGRVVRAEAAVDSIDDTRSPTEPWSP